MLCDVCMQARNQDFAKRVGGLRFEIKIFLYKNVLIDQAAEQTDANRALLLTSGTSGGRDSSRRRPCKSAAGRFLCFFGKK